MSIKMECGNCKYFNGLSENKYGKCNRFPPQVYALGSSSGRPDIRSDFPTVTQSDRCGEFSPKQQLINQKRQEFLNTL